MPRFFINQNEIHGDSITITGEDAKHIIKVLRMREGENITLCNGCGYDYEACISQIDKSSLEAKIISKEKNTTEPEIEITLFQGLPKSGKMEYIIQKCTELGINEIIPCIMEHCVVKLNSKDDVKKKTQRYQSIAEAAAKQSGRGIIPKVSDAVTFDEALNYMEKCDFCFIPYENEDGTSLKDVLKNVSGAKKIAFIIGPEGGFSESEIEKAKTKNIPTVTLGKRILRTETASTAVLSMINYEFLL